MQKRGHTEGLWTAIGVLFAFALILLGAYVLFGLMGMFTAPAADEQAAVNNFNDLAEIIDQLLADPAQFKAIDHQFQYNLPVGYILVGFDKDWHGDSKENTDSETPLNGKIEANRCSDGEGIAKPPQCMDKACLCVYKVKSFAKIKGDQFMESGREPSDVLGTCRTFNGDVSFLAPSDNTPNIGIILTGENKGLNVGAKKYPAPPNYYLSTEYEFLVIFGKCEETWRIRKVYIEKYTDQTTNKHYIFISEATDQIINIRKQYLENKHPS